jgi:hypothetical protein
VACSYCKCHLLQGIINFLPGNVSTLSQIVLLLLPVSESDFTFVCVARVVSKYFRGHSQVSITHLTSHLLGVFSFDNTATYTDT